jgi:hypothetical protein
VSQRLREAHLPRTKTFEEFDFSQSPKVSAAEIRQLAKGLYTERARTDSSELNACSGEKRSSRCAHDNPKKIELATAFSVSKHLI